MKATVCRDRRFIRGIHSAVKSVIKAASSDDGINNEKGTAMEKQPLLSRGISTESAAGGN